MFDFFTKEDNKKQVFSTCVETVEANVQAHSNTKGPGGIEHFSACPPVTSPEYMSACVCFCVGACVFALLSPASAC